MHLEFTPDSNAIQQNLETTATSPTSQSHLYVNNSCAIIAIFLFYGEMFTFTLHFHSIGAIP